jgi:hypothetical protein
MKKLFLIGLMLMIVVFSKAQINAVTETGDEVILFDDGTWKYVDGNSEKDISEIPLNSKEFIKDNQATFLVKSTRVDIGVYIDPKSWSFEKGTDQDEYEFSFQKKGEDLYAMIITEKMMIPIETLKSIALENARSVAPDIRATKEEFRNVNGIKVFMMQMEGTIQGIEFVYFGYYYSNSSGTIQLLSYTGKKLFDQYKDDAESLLNGLVEP